MSAEEIRSTRYPKVTCALQETLCRIESTLIAQLDLTTLAEEIRSTRYPKVSFALEGALCRIESRLNAHARSQSSPATSTTEPTPPQASQTSILASTSIRAQLWRWAAADQQRVVPLWGRGGSTEMARPTNSGAEAVPCGMASERKRSDHRNHTLALQDSVAQRAGRIEIGTQQLSLSARQYMSHATRTPKKATKQGPGHKEDQGHTNLPQRTLKKSRAHNMKASRRPRASPARSRKPEGRK